MLKPLICFFEGEVTATTAAIQLQPIKTTATVAKPLQSLHCAGPSTCQDLLLFSASTLRLLPPHSHSSAHKVGAAVEKQNPVAGFT